MRNLADQGVIDLAEGSAKGDPQVGFPAATGGEDDAFSLFRQVVERLSKRGKAPHLSGLKDQLRKLDPEFTEKRFGYGGFLQFAKAAQARGVIALEWDAAADDYVVSVA
jgi:hypothetical protein